MHDIRTIRALNQNFKPRTDKELLEHFKERALKAEHELNRYRMAEIRALKQDDISFREYFVREAD